MPSSSKQSVDWQSISQRFIDQNPEAAEGRMMSAPALTFAGKVFAFYSTKSGMDGIGCRLGRDYDIDAIGLTEWKHLAPFKTKPPMKDWIVVGQGDRARWDELLQLSFDVAKKRKGTKK